MRKYVTMAAGASVGGLLVAVAQGWIMGAVCAVFAFAFTSLLWWLIDR